MPALRRDRRRSRRIIWAPGDPDTAVASSRPIWLAERITRRVSAPTETQRDVRRHCASGALGVGQGSDTECNGTSGIGRAHCQRLGRGQRRAIGRPSTFYAFDVLRSAPGRLRNLPWVERRAVLDDLASPHTALLVEDRIRGACVRSPARGDPSGGSGAAGGCYSAGGVAVSGRLTTWSAITRSLTLSR